MLQLKDISYQFSGIPLFDKINWTINPKKRVALIGPNGAGKTTLIRLISQNIPLQEGIIQKPKSYQIGYLPQEEISFGRGSVLDEVLLADKQFGKIESEISDIHHRLDDGNLALSEQLTLTNQLGLLETRFALSGGYEREAQAKKILTGLGFKPGEFSDPIGTKSGGWRMRVYLARLLLQNPDLLLMDEPTNHLDIVSLEWLENFLVGYPGSIIIVSHDRFFIDRLANEIAELEHGRLTHYAGNYAYYEKEKEIRYTQLMQKAEAINAERERLTLFINRFRSKATKAVQVQDRIKRMEKLEIINLPKAKPRINFKINSPVKSYKDVCMLKGVSFRYAEPWVFQNIDMSLYRGDKVALVGANGEGKTTLTRLIFSQLQPQIGTVNIGERVKMGYYAQHQIDDLNTENNVYTEVESVAADELRTQILDILGVFRFSGDDTEKKVGVLSGGEKARVSLAKILLSPVNFLIMDEPTNHLDLYSKEALETALKNYDG
ncbi:MAG: ABC-F family ATP-binding cassette domain-containing protein, partial [Calditrichales bacterium]